jgi:anti-sigma B factor antagonist
VPDAGDDLAEIAATQISRDADRVCVVLTGEVDMSNAESILVELRTAAGDAVAVEVDLSELSFMDSAGIAMLHRLSRFTSEHDVELRIVARESCPAARTLLIAGMDAVLPLQLVQSTE